MFALLVSMLARGVAVVYKIFTIGTVIASVVT